METTICPRCKTMVEVVDGLARCPACGVRRHFGIFAAPPPRPKSTAITAGMPRASAAAEAAQAPSYLERLLRRLRGWRYPGEPYSDDELEIRHGRIGWLLLGVSLLPYLTCAPLVIFFPAFAFFTFMHDRPMFDDWRDNLIPIGLAAVPTALVGAVIWYRVHRRGA